MMQMQVMREWRMDEPQMALVINGAHVLAVFPVRCSGLLLKH